MWGNNSHGQTTEDSSVPIKIMENVKAVSLGDSHSAAIKEDGSLWMWGYNSSGQLGNGTEEKSNIPIKILDDVKSVSLGKEHSAAIKMDGSLWTWGGNVCGQLGNGTEEKSNIPIKIMDDVKSISLSYTHSAAIKMDGSLWTWGYNYYGCLGNGTIEHSKVPIKIMDDVKSVSFGMRHGVAIRMDGSLWMWGGNEYGELGSETIENYSLVPIQTMPPGSVKIPSTSPSDPDDDPINLPSDTEVSTKPQIKVVDSKGKPIVDAEITYRSKVTRTSAKGIAELDNYAKGYPLVIKKEKFVTKTVSSFVKNKTGRTTYILNTNMEQTDKPDGANQIIVTQDDSSTDMLTKDAYINVHDKNAVFSINCNYQESYDKYILYAGNKKIAESSDGNFSNIRCSAIEAGQQISLAVQGKTRKNPEKENLNLQVVDIDPKNYEVSFGDSISVEIPDDAPIMGGEKVELNLGEAPVTFKMSTDGTIYIGFNVGELAKEDKDWYSLFKQLDIKNLSKEFAKIDNLKKSPYSTDFNVKIMCGLETNVLTRDYLKGKAFIEISAAGSFDKQSIVAVGPVPVPVVIGVSLEGKVNSEGSISITAEKGIDGSLNAGIEADLMLSAGIGVINLASARIYGEADICADTVIFPQDDMGFKKLYVVGSFGVLVTLLNQNLAKWTILEGPPYYFIPKNGNAKAAAFVIDNDSTYDSLSRTYLTSAGTMPEWTAGSEAYADGSVDETLLQGSTCLDLIPQVVRMGDTVMLFYLADAGAGRSAADRSQLVYSLWDQTNEKWGEPKAVLKDDTADFNPDLYSDGTRIYAVWQEARVSLSENLTLNEIVDRLTLHAAVYDVQKDQFVDLGLIESENSLYQQNPQIVADGKEVCVYWYENAQDNVLGLSGTNRIYRASLSDQTVLAEGVQIMSVSENTVSAFRKYVALAEEIPTGEESVSENTTPEDEGEEPAMPPEDIRKDNGESGEQEKKEPTEEEPEKPEESVSENTVPEESVSENSISENSISENTLSANTFGMEKQTVQAWEITFLREEAESIYSADAGRADGSIGYAYAAGRLDNQYDVTGGRAVYLPKDKEAVTLDDNRPESVEFTSVYAGETLTWYRGGDIYYLEENGNTVSLFGEARIPSIFYTLLSDGTGNPEVIFPVNVGGKSELYRIGRENGAFTDALQITEQEDYIQYADGFVKDGKTMLVYNKMKVNDKLEEMNNSLCTGVLKHSYYDVALKSAGSMIRQDADSGEDVLEISAHLYNNGTEAAEGISLSLCKADGTHLETKAIEGFTLKAGESAYGTAIFDLDHIQEAADYQVTAVSEKQESNTGNNTVQIALGDANLQINAEMLAIADSRTLEVSITNTGVAFCGGNLCVRDAESGKEYCSSDFEQITRGQTILAEIPIDSHVFTKKDALLLEVVVKPKGAGQETITEYVSATAPKYRVSFVTADGVQDTWVSYGARVSFPQNPQKEGKYFIGWYDAENPAAGTLYTEETPVTQDLTLYACFADQERMQIPLSECSVSEIPMQYYTGGQIKPTVTVKWGSEVLKANQDYKVTYQNNKEQGTAAVTVTAVKGSGKKYTGSITRNFSIMYPTKKVSVKTIPAVSFTGESHTPEPVVTYRNKTLVKDTDYTVSYFNNRNAGTAGVTITGKGTFSGEKTVNFKINGTAITGMQFEKIPDVTYNGKNTRPTVTIRTKDEKTQLMSGSDYRLVYENTVNKGTATVTVIGNGNYTGTKKLTYKVTAKPLAESMIAVEQPAAASLAVLPEKAVYQYTGKPVKPAITVTDQAAGDAALVLNKDYTVSYSKNKAVGEAQITVKGKGNYSGTLKVPFTIRPVDLSQGMAAGTIRVQVNDSAYTGKALKPAVQVYETVEGKERKLSGSAYTLSYANNTEKGTGTVTVTGKEKSGYTGTVTANFRIVDKAKLITASAIKIDAIPGQTYTGSALEPVLHIVDKSNKNQEVTLGKGTHYEVTYRDNVSVGKATVTVKGIGSYAGSRDLTFKIGKRALADKNGLCAGFTVKNPADLKYTGYALKPDVTVKDGNKLLVQGKDYKLSYSKNTNIGTAAMTVIGIGNYSGSYKGAVFQIKAWNYSTLTAEIADQVYTGKALRPQVTFYMTDANGREEILLKPNKAVKIVYKDNKNAGTATVAISGKGELANITPITVNFEIERADIGEADVARIPNQTLKGMAVKPVPKVKVGKNSLKVNRDFTVSYLRNGVKGEATVIIRGVGNYTGECRKTFIVQ